MSDCNSFRSLRSSLDRLSWGGLEFWSVRLLVARIVSASPFSRFFTASCIVAMISLIGSVLEVIEKLRSFARRSVSIWVNCLKDILITHFFLSVILAALCVTLFVLISSSNFRVGLFLVKSEHLLYKFWWTFSTRWNSLGVLDSKILPCNCSMLF